MRVFSAVLFWPVGAEARRRMRKIKLNHRDRERGFINPMVACDTALRVVDRFIAWQKLLFATPSADLYLWAADECVYIHCWVGKMAFELWFWHREESAAAESIESSSHERVFLTFWRKTRRRLLSSLPHGAWCEAEIVLECVVDGRLCWLQT